MIKKGLLNGKKFLWRYENGIYAIAEADVVKGSLLKKAISDEYFSLSKASMLALSHLDTPIFTFAEDHLTAECQVYTGSDRFFLHSLKRWIQRNNGEVIESDTRFHVPFSQAAHMGLQGEEAQVIELSYVTSYVQFRDTFGADRDEILSQLRIRE